LASRLGNLIKTYASMQRYRQILFVLLRYGFGDLLSALGVDQYLRFRWLPFRKRVKEEIATLSRAQRIRLALQELGPTFVKMGQTLSTRSDLLPADIMRELEHLQDDVPAFAGEIAKRILTEELGRPYEEVFAEFAEEPVAAGSIGQVHRARLHTGEAVVVKVQRPGIRRQIHTDLEIMHDLARLMEKHMELGQVHKPMRIVDEFSRTIDRELDYMYESANVDRFRVLFGDHPFVYVHKVYPEHTSHRVLTLEMIEGIRPNEVERLEAAGLRPDIIARRGARLMMKQVFEYGFFHADPHPGNLFVLPENVICFLDFGMMGRIDTFNRERFAELIVHVVRHDEAHAAETLLKLTRAPSTVDRALLEREIAELMDRYLYQVLDELELGPMIQQLLQLTAKHEMRIPAPFFLLIKALSQIEDLGVRLDPSFQLSAELEPYVRKLILSRYKPGRIARNLFDTASDLVYLLRDIPGEMRELVKQARSGRIKVELEHLGLKPLARSLDRLSSRIASSIVLGSLIVGSSLIIHSEIPPRWHEIPVIGLVGYVLSGIMGISLLRSIIRDKVE